MSKVALISILYHAEVLARLVHLYNYDYGQMEVSTDMAKLLEPLRGIYSYTELKRIIELLKTVGEKENERN